MRKALSFKTNTICILYNLYSQFYTQHLTTRHYSQYNKIFVKQSNKKTKTRYVQNIVYYSYYIS